VVRILFPAITAVFGVACVSTAFSENRDSSRHRVTSAG
jgi:hypothetical protein